MLNYATSYVESYIGNRWTAASVNQKAYLLAFSLWFRLVVARARAGDAYRKSRVMHLLFWLAGMCVVACSFMSLSKTSYSLDILLTMYVSIATLTVVLFAIIWVQVYSACVLFEALLSWYSRRFYPTEPQGAFKSLSFVSDDSIRASAQSYLMAFSGKNITHVTIALAVLYGARCERNATE